MIIRRQVKIPGFRFKGETMKTPQIVGKYRLGIIRRMMAGELTTDQAENIQRMTDREIKRLLMQNKPCNT
jgi:hypothetical protein